MAGFLYDGGIIVKNFQAFVCLVNIFRKPALSFAGFLSND
jgi:hypothetical protein